MKSNTSAAIATVVLRVSLGIMFLAHGLVLKLSTFGLAGTAGFFESVGFPGWMAYVVIAMESAGGAALILGIGTRWVAAALTPILVGAVTVHAGNGWVFNTDGGGWEYPVYLVVLAVAQVLLGSGPLSLDRRLGLERSGRPA